MGAYVVRIGCDVLRILRHLILSTQQKFINFAELSSWIVIVLIERSNLSVFKSMQLSLDGSSIIYDLFILRRKKVQGHYTCYTLWDTFALYASSTFTTITWRQAPPLEVNDLTRQKTGPAYKKKQCLISMSLTNIIMP